MPRLNGQALLRDACNWSLGSLESFEYSQKLANCGMNTEAQKMNFILNAAKGFESDGLDNLDPEKAHPAVIQDPISREEADELTKLMLIRIVRNPFLFTRHNSRF